MELPDLRPCLSLRLLPTEIQAMLEEGDTVRTLNRSRQTQILPPIAIDNEDVQDDNDDDDVPRAMFSTDEFSADGDGGDEAASWTEEVAAGGMQGSGGTRDKVARSQTPGLLPSTWDYVTANRAALGLSLGQQYFKPPRPKPSDVIRPAPRQGVQRPRRRASVVDFEYRPELLHGYSEESTKTHDVGKWQSSRHLLKPNDPEKGKRCQNFSLRTRCTPRLGNELQGLAREDTPAKEPQDVVDLDVTFHADHDAVQAMGDHAMGDHAMGDHAMGDHAMGDHEMGDHEMEGPGTSNASACSGTLATPGVQPLSYAKRAKKVDMRMLKRCTWQLIQCHLDTKEKAGSSDEVTFSQIYDELPNELSPEMAANLTPSLAFVAVLHLANEHALSLRNSEDLGQLFISKADHV